MRAVRRAMQQRGRAAGRTGSPRRRAICSGGDEAVEVEQVDRAPDRGVEEDAAACPRSGRRGAARSAMPAWAMISVASVARRRAARARRRSAAGRGRRGSGSGRGARPRARRPARAARRSSRNFCARGWSLIPRAPRSRQRVASSIGLLVEVEPDEGDEAALRAGRERERAVVAGPEARMPVGLVEAEDERARDPVALAGSARAPRSRRPSRRCRCRDGCGRRRSPRSAGSSARTTSW